MANVGYYLPLWAIASFATLIMILLGIVGSMLTMGISQLRRAIGRLEKAVADLVEAQNSFRLEVNKEFVSMQFFTFVHKQLVDDLEETREMVGQSEARIGKNLHECKREHRLVDDDSSG